jgi:hypothetical protein
LWTRVVEPDVKAGNRGSIYLWVEEVDGNNVPSGLPRSYRLPYSVKLADRTLKARDEIMAGNPQEGLAEDVTEGDPTSADASAKPNQQADGGITRPAARSSSKARSTRFRAWSSARCPIRAAAAEALGWNSEPNLRSGLGQTRPPVSRAGQESDPVLLASWHDTRSLSSARRTRKHADISVLATGGLRRTARCGV